MIRKFALLAALLGVAGCVPSPVRTVSGGESLVDVQILAINDFHGNLEPSADPVTIATGSGNAIEKRVGGAARLAAALETARAGQRNTITVAAGDLIGASPLSSAYFLDEPTIDAMNLLGLSVASVGNHEFDKGSAELLRMQRGGCDKHTTRVPCRLEPFAGARFDYLAANALRADGTSLFPSTAIRQVGPVRLGFIGMTLKDTGTLVTPAGVAGLRFADEAATANALVPRLRAQGADAIVLLIHQGGRVPETYVEQGCAGLTGDILPILDRLDPAILTIVSGHTHQAYACELDRGGARRMLTSAGKYGYLYTDLRLTFDASTRRLIRQAAANIPVDGTTGSNPRVAALVKRYADAAAPAAARVVGRLPGPLLKSTDETRESPVADLIADAQFAATRAANRGGADLSFINSGGVRSDLVPRADGSITYGQIFALEPFGNGLVVKTLTGAQLKAVLEQQFTDKGGVAALQPSILVPSANFQFAYDFAKPDGQRIVSMSLDGRPIDARAPYRVTVNNFLASGGDGYSVLSEATDPFDAGLDLDALEAWLATNPAVPRGGRIHDVTTR
jgi:5'-nucleotidase